MLDICIPLEKEWVDMALTYFKKEGNLLSTQIDATIDAKRFDGICSELAQAVADFGNVKLIIVMKHYPSFNSAEDLYDDLRFVKLFSDRIDKVAIVCDKQWKRTWVALFALFSGVRLRFFDMSSMSAAVNWIQAD